MKHTYRLFSFFFLVTLATTLKAAVPSISSSLDSQTYWVDEDFIYTITATESPTLFLAGGYQALGGLTLDSATGDIAGALSNAGEFELAIAAENLDGESPVATIDVVVVRTAITSPSSTNGVVGEELSYEITTDSGVAVTYSDSGLLPPGLARVDNIISGMPTLAGIYPVTLSASDSNGSGEIVVTFTISDPVPVITSSLQEEILLGDAFNYTITATESPTGFSATGLPELGPFAVFLNSTTGVISGTPTIADDFDISITATNSVGSSQPATLNLVVHPGFITSSSTKSGVVDSPFVFEITTFKDEGLAYGNEDDLPPGLTRVDNIISGTPTLAGTYPVTISAASLTNYDNQVLTITVTDPAPEITSSLADQNVLAGVPYAGYQITGTYSPTGYSATGLAAVGGMNFDAVTGIISGTPVNSGSFPITIAAENVPAGFGDPATFNLIVSPTVITSPSSTSGVVGTPLTYEITTAGTSPLAYGVAGSLPSGLSRSGTTISGTPDQAGTYTVTLSASNLDGTGSLSVDFVITDPAPAIDSSLAAQTIIVNKPFTYTITATNNPTGFSANGLDLIGGLGLDPITGVISGSPLNEGDWVIQIGAENDAGTTPLENLNLVVKAAQYFLEGEVGVSFNHTLTTTLANASIGVSGLGQIPGISRDSGTDDISGTPEEYGIYVITVSAADEDGATDIYDITVTINKSGGSAPIPAITSSTSVLLYEGDPINYRIQADGIPDSFEVFGLGQLGLTLDPVTGVITGTPVLTGDFRLPVRVTNAAGTGSDILELTIVPDISPEVIITSPAAGNAFTAADSVEILINATDTDGFVTTVSVSVDGAVVGDATPTGLAGQYRYTLSTGTDDIGTRSLQVTATDDRGNSTDSNIQNFAVTPGAVPEVNIITPAAGFNATVGVPYEIRVSAVDADGVIAAVGINDILFGREPPTTNTNAAGDVTVTPGSIIAETKSFGGQQNENVLTLMQPSSIPGEYVLYVTATFTDIVDLIATAVDDAGNVVTSVPVQYSVNAGIPPDVSIVSPIAADGSVASVRVIGGSNSTANSGGGTFDPAIVEGDPVTLTFDAPAANGTVTGVTLTQGGTFDSLVVATNPVTVTFSAPEEATGTIATGTVVMNATNDAVSSVTIVNPGSGYTSTPTLTFAGGGMTAGPTVEVDIGATATGTVVMNADNDAILAVTIINPGSGYTSAPTLTFAGGGMTVTPDTEAVMTGTAQRGTLVPIDITASDADGTIIGVEVFNGAISLGQAIPLGGLNSYRFDYEANSAGEVYLQVRATDDRGNVGISDIVIFSVMTGDIPSLSITSPISGSPVVAGDELEILIDATDEDGFINILEIYNGSTLLGSASPTENPGKYRFNFVTSGNDVGMMNLQARAVDDSGNVTASAPINLGVTPGAVPVVNITYPSSEDVLPVNIPIHIKVEASDSDGSIASVELYDLDYVRTYQLYDFVTGSFIEDSGIIDFSTRSFFADVMQQSGNQNEFVYNTTLANSDIVELIAVATDNSGNVVNSTTVRFTVAAGNAPTATITSPTAANGTAANGTVGSVNIIDGGTFDSAAVSGNPVTVTFSAPEEATGTIATGTVVMNATNDAVSSVTIVNPGSGYTSTPTLTFAGGGMTIDPTTAVVLTGTYVLGDTIAIDIVANDSDGSVSSVQVYNGSALLGTATRTGNNTFRFNFGANVVGSLNLQVRVTDDSGNVSVSTLETIFVETGVLPVVAIDQINSISDGDSVTAGDNTVILIQASDPDGFVTQVNIYNGNTLLGQADRIGGPANQYRYYLLTSLDNIGTLNLEARATDDRGNVVSSEVVDLKVTPGIVPTVSIDSPSAPFSAQVGVPFEVRVSAADDESVDSVILRDINFQREAGTTEDGVFTPGAIIESTRSINGALMQESSVEGEYVYTATLNNPDIVVLVAVALDNAGNQVTSLPVQFVVTNGIPPTVEITSPIDGGDSPYTLGGTIPIVITAADADGSVSSVEVYSDSTLLGTADRISNNTFRLNYSVNSVGSFNLQARVTDNSGITSVSSIETISVAVTPPLASDLQASRIALNVSQNVELSVRASSVDQAISTVIFKANDEVIGLSDTPTTQIGSNTSDLYILNWKPDTVGIFELSVEVQDSSSILTSLSGPTITVTAFDPSSNDENFITDVFLRLFNQAPTDTQLEEGLSVLNGSIASKASYVSSLLDSATAEQVQDAITIYRTITGEWPSSSELINATASLLGTAPVRESITGEFVLGNSLFFSDSVKLSREFLADTNVTATLTVDGISPYSNLIVRRPDGTLVASDFSFGESPNVNFITSTSGTYSFEFYEYLPNSANSYTIAIDRINASGTPNPKALVDALMPEYTLNFGTFEISADNISQLFYNKHGTYPNAVNLVRLYSAFSDSTDINDTIGQFALDDNKISTFVGANGMPLSDLYSYEIPNDMTAGKKVALTLSVFLGEAPSDQDVADYSSMLLEQALEVIILKAYTSVPSALSGAISLGSDWYESSWFGMFAYPVDSSNWIYSLRLGWVYVADSGTPSGAWFYSSNLGAWLWSSSEINGYYYLSGMPGRDNQWIYMLPTGADSPGAWLNYMDKNQWQFVMP